ncbi:hypothetical protein [Baia soyae]|uniref:Uncharacterized protein n=1 Tax=Baia soyae TaxID=1544746 RepID=A0A4R2RMF8_9BACL|nr:hypothetical protein [Baia soyae]TCP63849.1 hypothetical protein EDD57_14622 [Baia soyae]
MDKSQSQDLQHTLSYLHNEINRIEAIAETLSTRARDHYHQLTNYEDKGLTDMAVEEQHAARQLATIQKMCITMAGKLGQLNEDGNGDNGWESGQVDQTH